MPHAKIITRTQIACPDCQPTPEFNGEFGFDRKEEGGDHEIPAKAGGWFDSYRAIATLLFTNSAVTVGFAVRHRFRSLFTIAGFKSKEFLHKTAKPFERPFYLTATTSLVAAIFYCASPMPFAGKIRRHRAVEEA
jgi:hypothetical protein